MKIVSSPRTVLALCLCALFAATASAQIGRRFPSEKKIVPDPVTGVPLNFLTSTPAGDQKIYPTHQQWSSDGKWVIFRSNRVPRGGDQAGGEAMAVNEETGDIVQLTEKGYTGMLCASIRSMKLFYMRDLGTNAPAAAAPVVAEATPAAAGAAAVPQRGGNRARGPFQIIELNLEKLFADSAAGKMKSAENYERVCGTIPDEMRGGGDLAIDATDEVAYFRVGGPDLASKLPAGTKPAERYGPRNMGAGPTGIGRMNLKTGECGLVVAVPFQVGHIQTNPWVPGEIVFCWETGGKSPQRTWTVMGDGTGLRPLYPEQEYEWVTHEAIVSKDEVAIALIEMGVNGPDGKPAPRRRAAAAAQTAAPQATRPTQPAPAAPAPTWGPAGGAASSEHPTGLAIVNLRTRQTRIIGQLPPGDPGRSIWHIHASPDGRWAVGDDFQYRLWLIDRKSGEMKLLTDNGHKTTAQDHQHPTFSLDSTRIQFQSAMLSEDGRSLNMCVVHVPKSWMERTYSEKF